MRSFIMFILASFLVTGCEDKDAIDPISELSITSPKKGTRLHNRQPVTFSAQSVLPFTMAEFYVDGKLLMTDKEAPFSFSWVPVDIPGGQHILKVVGVPASGNMIERTSEFHIDLSYGETFGGGRVFYLEGDGEHGLVAADLDQTTGDGLFWWGRDSLVHADSRTDGQVNTTKMGGDYSRYAAYLINEHYYDPSSYYLDWYVPSVEEALILYRNRHFLQGLVGDESKADYWSSTEAGTQQALKVNLVSGRESLSYKNTLHRVRPIRKF